MKKEIKLDVTTKRWVTYKNQPEKMSFEVKLKSSKGRKYTLTIHSWEAPKDYEQMKKEDNYNPVSVDEAKRIDAEMKSQYTSLYYKLNPQLKPVEK